MIFFLAYLCIGSRFDGTTIYCLEISNLSRTGKIPFLSPQVSIVFHSADVVDSDAQGFSIQVVQLTDCTTPVIEEKELSFRDEDAPCKIPLFPYEVVNLTDIETRKDQECAYVINQEEGKTFIDKTVTYLLVLSNDHSCPCF